MEKNLIGTFSQPKLVINDIFFKKFKKKEMICGYAEILKHSLIKDKVFFNWLKLNTQNIFLHERAKKIIYAIKRSCKLKFPFVNKDEKEKKFKDDLNFGHTFAHAIEIKNNYSKNKLLMEKKY